MEAQFPEDPALPRYLKDIGDLCAWRDQHMPGKPVWITEFGYDSTTKPQEKSGTFAKWEGVTDEQQAQWLVRSLLVFSSMPVERAYIYFFNDEDKPSVHASSGLTRNFKPKPSFHAVSHCGKRSAISASGASSPTNPESCACRNTVVTTASSGPFGLPPGSRTAARPPSPMSPGNWSHHPACRCPPRRPLPRTSGRSRRTASNWKSAAARSI